MISIDKNNIIITIKAGYPLSDLARYKHALLTLLSNLTDVGSCHSDIMDHIDLVSTLLREMEFTDEQMMTINAEHKAFQWQGY